MCASLPLALFPPYLLYKIGYYDSIQKEKAALRTGHYCARVLIKVIPFIKVQIEGSPPKPEPSVWVCNHSSMLDVFVMLANDHTLRGPNRRPIKIVYVSTNECMEYRNGTGIISSSVTKLRHTHSSYTHTSSSLFYTVETIGRQSGHKITLSTMRFHSCPNGRQWPWKGQ